MKFETMVYMIMEGLYSSGELLDDLLHELDC